MQSNFDSSWLGKQQGGDIDSSESCEPKRYVWCWNKVERKYFQEQQPNQFHCYNQNMVFVNKMDQNVVYYSNGIRIKKMMVVPVL